MNILENIDQSVIEKIRSGNQKFIVQIYSEVYPIVLKHILSNNGSKEDAQDVFQDAYFILIRKTDDPDFVLTCQLSTFLMGVSKKLWLKKLTKNQINPSLYKEEILFNESDFDEEDEEKLVRIKTVAESISSLGEPCKTLLIQYYYFKQTMKEIALLLHYTNAENAKNQKYKCLQRLKKMITPIND